MNGPELAEAGTAVDLAGGAAVHAGDFGERTALATSLGLGGLTRQQVAGPEAVLLNQPAADVNVAASGQIPVPTPADEAGAFGRHVENAEIVLVVHVRSPVMLARVSILACASW
jgi:hypothetical protein